MCFVGWKGIHFQELVDSLKDQDSEQKVREQIHLLIEARLLLNQPKRKKNYLSLSHEGMSVVAQFLAEQVIESSYFKIEELSLLPGILQAKLAEHPSLQEAKHQETFKKILKNIAPEALLPLTKGFKKSTQREAILEVLSQLLHTSQNAWYRAKALDSLAYLIEASDPEEAKLIEQVSSTDPSPMVRRQARMLTENSCMTLKFNQKRATMTELKLSEIEALGLDAATIQLHSERIKGLIESKRAPVFPISDCARIDNGGIVSFDTLKSWAKAPAASAQPVSFIPAAGAASRYFQPFCELKDFLSHQTTANASQLSRIIEALLQDGAAQWPLPKHLKDLIATRGASYSPAKKDALLRELHECKALQPATKEGSSFLELKLNEHQKMPYLLAECYIVADGKSAAFRQAIEEHPNTQLPKLLLEQGPKLSTLRFLENGQLYRDAKGNLSSVPAGHGTLVHLMEEAKERLPEAKSLFIRNIDNTMGPESKDAFEATEVFLSSYAWYLDNLNQVRQALKENKLEEAATARTLLDETSHLDEHTQKFLSRFSPNEGLCWRLLFERFHCSMGLAERFITESSNHFEAFKVIARASLKLFRTGSKLRKRRWWLSSLFKYRRHRLHNLP